MYITLIRNGCVAAAVHHFGFRKIQDGERRQPHKVDRAVHYNSTEQQHSTAHKSSESQ